MVKKTARSSLKRIITHWHRRLGIISALIVVLISFSGILLNHSDRLGLPARSVQAHWLLSLYNIELPDLVTFGGVGNQASQLAHNLFLNGKPVDPCHGSLVGAVYIANLHYIACSESLLIYTEDHLLVERIEPAHGLPTTLDALGSAANDLVVRSGQLWYRADLEILEWQPVSDAPGVVWSQSQAVSPSVEQIMRSEFSSDISWERVVQDFHAGRFLGSLGPLFMDAVAIGFILLALSGCWLWFRGRKAR